MFALAVSRSSIYRWRAIFNQHGSVNRPPSALIGCARLITHAFLTAVQALYETEADLYLDELVSWLGVHHNIEISVSALCENLKTAGLTRKILYKIAAERDEELRRQWQDMQLRPAFTGTGEEFVCLDETSNNELSYAQRYSRAPSGQRAEPVFLLAYT